MVIHRLYTGSHTGYFAMNASTPMSEKREQLTSVGTGAQTTARTAGLHSTSAKFPRAKSEPPMYDALPANADGRITIVYGPHGTHRATTFDPSFAELAVRACNAHDDLVAALRDTLARFNALRKAIHESSTHATAENIQSRFNLHLGRDGIETGTQPALEFASAALAKAGAL